MLRFLLLSLSILFAAPAYWTQKSIGTSPVGPFSLARLDTTIDGQIHDTADTLRKSIATKPVRHRFSISSTTGVPPLTMSYNNTTRVLTLTPTGTSFSWWWYGLERVQTGPLVLPAHSATTGLYYASFDSLGTVNISTTPFDLLRCVPIALFDRNSTLGQTWVYPELHTDQITPLNHLARHTTVGALMVPGGAAISGYTLNSDLLASVTYGIGSATVWDEDAKHSIAALADGGPYQVRFRTAPGVWSWASSLSTPYRVGTTYITADIAGIQTELNGAGLGQFVNYYVVLVPTLNGPQTVMFQGQAIHATEAEAEAETWQSLDRTGLPAVEFVPVWQITYKAQVSFTGVTGRVQMVRAAAVGATTGSGAVSSSTLQSAYNASPTPQIVTSTASGALIVRRGTASDPDAVVQVQDGAGNPTVTLSGNGQVAFNDRLVQGVTERLSAAGDLTVASATVTGATASKLARFDASKTLTSYDLVAADIPSLAASKITSGTFTTDRIPSLAGDVTGNIGSTTVGRILGQTIPAWANGALRYNGGVITWDNSVWDNTAGANKFWAVNPVGDNGFRAILAADVPTLNQNTTGSAATLTTPRTLTIGSTGKTFNGSANVSWSLAEIGAQAAGTYLTPSNVSGTAGQVAVFTGTNTVGSDAGFTRGQTSSVTTSLIVGDGAVAAAPVIALSSAAGQESQSWNIQGGKIRWKQMVASDGNTWSLQAFSTVGTFGTLIDAPVSVANASGGTIALGGSTNRPITHTGTLALTSVGLFARTATDNANYFALFHNSLTPSATNFAFKARNDGLFSIVNAATASILQVGGADIARAEATRLNLGSGVALQINGADAITSARAFRGASESIFSNGTYTDPQDGTPRDAKFGGLGISTASLYSAGASTLAGATELLGSVRLSSTTPRLELYETDATTTNRNWVIEAGGDRLSIGPRSDAGGSGSGTLFFERSGTGLTKTTVSSPLAVPSGIIGITDANPAVAGNVGETMTNNRSYGGRSTLSYPSATAVATVTLSAGHWMVTGAVNATSSATSNVVVYLNTTGTNPDNGTEIYMGVSSGFAGATTAPKFYNVDATTTVSIYAQPTGSDTPPGVWGTISAVRIR